MLWAWGCAYTYCLATLNVFMWFKNYITSNYKSKFKFLLYITIFTKCHAANSVLSTQPRKPDSLGDGPRKLFTKFSRPLLCRLALENLAFEARVDDGACLSYKQLLEPSSEQSVMYYVCCSHTTQTELSGCNRYHVACNTINIKCLLPAHLQRNVLIPVYH